MPGGNQYLWGRGVQVSLRLSHHRQQQHGKQWLLLRTAENWVTLGQPCKFDDSIPKMSSWNTKRQYAHYKKKCSTLK